MRSLEEAIARLVDPLVFELAEALENAEGEPGQLRADATAMRDQRLSVAMSRSSAILALIRDRLLSEEAVEAGYDATRLPDGTPQFADAGFCLGHAAKILLAAMDRIESPTHQPVSGEVADG